MNLWLLIIFVVAGLLTLAILAVSIYLCRKQGMCQCKKKQPRENTKENSKVLESEESSIDKLNNSEDRDLDYQEDAESGSNSFPTGSIFSEGERSSLSTLESGRLQRYTSMTSMSTITSERRKSLKLEESCGIIRFKLEFIQEQKELVLHIFYIYLGPIEPPSSSTLYSVNATILPKKKQKFETKAQPFAPAAEEEYIVASFKKHMMIFKKIEDVKSLFRQALRLRIGEHKIGSETIIAEALVHLADLVQTDPLYALDVWRPLYKTTPFQKLNVRSLVQHAVVLQQNLKKSSSGNIELETRESTVSESGDIPAEESYETNDDPGVHSPDDEGIDEIDLTTSNSMDDIQSSRANLLAPK